MTDPDNRIMKMQAGTSRLQRPSGGDGGGTDHRADEVTQETSDFQQLHPMVERVQANLKAIAHPQTVGPALADAGYCSEANLTEPDPAGPAMLIALNKGWKQRKVLRE